jgi:hypothetical protein
MNNAGQLPVCGGYSIYLAASGCPTLKIPVQSADMASAMFQRYRDWNGIGASDMKLDCGSVFANDGTLVAKVSYNGRVWNPQGKLLQEPPASVPVTPSHLTEFPSDGRRVTLDRVPERTAGPVVGKHESA